LDFKAKYSNNLLDYDLSTDLFDLFSLTVNDLTTVRGVYLLNTDKGDKILKKLDYSLDRFNFICDGIKYIKNKFDRVMDFEKAKNGEQYVRWKGSIYCIMPLVKGRECDFNNPIDLSIASEGLGELHLASEGLKSNLNGKYLNGKLINVFNRRIDEILFFKEIANFHEHKTEFDNLYLEKYEGYLEDIKKSIDILQNSKYYKLCSEEDKVVLCHHDLAHHNIIINQEKAYFIDFDYCIIDLKIHDLCNLINKISRNFAYDMEKTDLVISSYLKTNSLDKRELQVLYGMLNFPESFYTICRDYYTRKKDWEEDVFYNKFRNKIECNEFRNEFLNEFEKKYS
jgi:CotS family spore coat protein